MIQPIFCQWKICYSCSLFFIKILNILMIIIQMPSIIFLRREYNSSIFSLFSKALFRHVLQLVLKLAFFMSHFGRLSWWFFATHCSQSSFFEYISFSVHFIETDLFVCCKDLSDLAQIQNFSINKESDFIEGNFDWRYIHSKITL